MLERVDTFGGRGGDMGENAMRKSVHREHVSLHTLQQQCTLSYYLPPQLINKSANGTVGASATGAVGGIAMGAVGGRGIGDAVGTGSTGAGVGGGAGGRWRT
jgi:hypothetical protein